RLSRRQPCRRHQQLRQHLSRRQRPCGAGGSGRAFRRAYRTGHPRGAPASTIGGIREFLTGLHLQHFEHWLLRWFYVLGGLSGCACIATGFIFFVEKRKRQHARAGIGGARWADAFAVTAVTGMLIATLAILVANRLLPAGLPHRGDCEERIFWAIWLLAFVHAAWRTAPVRHALLAPAWIEQCWAVAVLAVAAMALNALTTGDHLLRALASGYWPVAGVDLALLATAALAAVAARHLRRRAGAHTRDSDPSMAATPEAAHG